MRTIYYIHRNGIERSRSAESAEQASNNGYTVTAEVKE